MKVEIEVTDTFGGEANYSWVKRTEHDLAKPTVRAIARKVRELAGWPTLIRMDIEDYGDQLTFRPRGLAQVCFVTVEM